MLRLRDVEGLVQLFPDALCSIPVNPGPKSCALHGAANLVAGYLAMSAGREMKHEHCIWRVRRT